MTDFVAPLKSRGLITVAGPDRAEFLQGLISNDIVKVTQGKAIWAALLTPQGKYLHDFFVIEINDVFYIDCEGARLIDLGQRLHKYKLRANVQLDVAKSFSVAAFWGDGPVSALGLPKNGDVLQKESGSFYVDPRLAAAGVRAVLSETVQLGEFVAGGFEISDEKSYDYNRLELGLSDGSRDLVVEKSILLESNFDELNGVDWEKGCYMGQELTARTKYRGLVKKRLVPVTIVGPDLAPGTLIYSDGRDVGEIRSSQNGSGLALLRLETLIGKTELTAAQSKIEPRVPKWMNLSEKSPS